MPLPSRCLGNLNRAGLGRRLSGQNPALSWPSGMSSLEHYNFAARCILSRENLALRARSHATATLANPVRSTLRSSTPTTPQGQPSGEAFDALEQDTAWPRSISVEEQDVAWPRPLGSGVDHHGAPRALEADGSNLVDPEAMQRLANQAAEAQRKEGSEGVLRLWASILADDVTLSEVHGPAADLLWNTILDAALSNDEHLETVFMYANRMLESYAVQWPNLYERVVAECLGNLQTRRAFHWHAKLIVDFDPGLEGFVSLLKTHIHNPNPAVQDALRSMVMTSFHRGLYDAVIPWLFEHGSSGLALIWRDFFLRFADVPGRSAASQPFLRFMDAYYPEKELVPEEQAVKRSTSTLFSAAGNIPSDLDTSHAQSPARARYLSDRMGAKWFASAWVPLDFAIHALQSMNIHHIGPLSLQSLALREPDTKSVRTRLEQLRKLDVEVVDSNYARALRYFAERADEEMMLALLHTDIHPDVFDDPDTQRKILEDAEANGDKNLARLLLAVQPAITQHSVASASNEVLQEHLQRLDVPRAISMIDEMRAKKIGIFENSYLSIHELLLEKVARDLRLHSSNPNRILSDVMALAEKATSYSHMMPSKVWQNILLNLGEMNRVDDLEKLALTLVRDFELEIQESPGLMAVHPSDSPLIPLEGTYPTIPTDIPIKHDWHPIRRIFNIRHLQGGFIQWGFQRAIRHSESEALAEGTPRLQPADFGIARGVRVLKELNNCGLPLEIPFIRSRIMNCLARHCTKVIEQEQSDEKLPVSLWPRLGETRDLFNEAFGDELLPEPMVLRDLVIKAMKTEFERGTQLKAKSKSSIQERRNASRHSGM